MKTPVRINITNILFLQEWNMFDRFQNSSYYIFIEPWIHKKLTKKLYVPAIHKFYVTSSSNLVHGSILCEISKTAKDRNRVQWFSCWNTTGNLVWWTWYSGVLDWTSLVTTTMSQLAAPQYKNILYSSSEKKKHCYTIATANVEQSCCQEGKKISTTQLIK